MLSQAILPLAGLGTRFLPWTKVVPKELLPLGNQPIVAHLVHECLDIGIHDICFVINKGKEMIPQYFYSDPGLEEELRTRGKDHLLEELKRYDSVNLHVVYQDEMLGDGHAILQAKDWVNSDTVAVLYGDDLFIGADTALKQLLEAQEASGDSEVVLALEDIEKELVSKYGIVEVKTDLEGHPHIKNLSGFVEKPHPDDAPSTLGVVGRYLLNRQTFAILPTAGASHGGEIRLIDALIQQVQTEPVLGVVCEGKRLDTGTPEGYQRAVRSWEMGK